MCSNFWHNKSVIKVSCVCYFVQTYLANKRRNGKSLYIYIYIYMAKSISVCLLLSYSITYIYIYIYIYIYVCVCVCVCVCVYITTQHILANPRCSSAYNTSMFSILDTSNTDHQLSVSRAIYLTICQLNLCKQKDFYNLPKFNFIDYTVTIPA